MANAVKLIVTTVWLSIQSEEMSKSDANFHFQMETVDITVQATET